jgi:hypothetical protein
VATAALVTDSVRRLLGDDDSAVYTDATLIPAAGQGPVNHAYRVLQARMVNRGCSVLRDTSAVLSVGAGVVVINAASTPALPADFIVPYDLWERPAGGTNADWALIDRGDVLPDRLQTSYLGDWKFEGGGIDLVGATQGVEIKMLYEKLLTPFATTGDAIGILGAEDALSYYTASLMAVSRGMHETAQYMDTKFEDALGELVNRFTHSNQAVHGRRRLAYGRRATGLH